MEKNRSVIRELLKFEFELGHSAKQAMDNINRAKGAGTCHNRGNLGHGLGNSPAPTTTMQTTSTVKPADGGHGHLYVGTFVRNDIWNNAAFPTPAAKITDIVKNFKSYNANNLSKQQVLMSISIEVWHGTIQQFCDCGSGS
ncbi:hypothetical protein DdX_13807 [Ditylenchus destructor]|uniref:Uncharacterized protein n=1 Tax=Ditylenchus destructor TaxID=166010 RepID=A0AAD4MT00_9BILA|nr:hypothetical protein DdX_13807 [Ditylenchus destructor]